MKNINVIGGSGFIGTRLVRRLKQNAQREIKIIDKVPSQAFPDLRSHCDVRSLGQVRECISDGGIIVNLAAEHHDDVRPLSLYDEVNVGGAVNICSAAREKDVQTIVFTSTVAVYGFAPIGTDESGTIAPYNDYGRTKYEAEEVFKAWQAESPGERTLVIIRPTVVFGEQNRGNVYNLMRQIASGKFVMIGHGENRKSMAYVENLAAFIEYCLTFKPGVHLYNFVDKPDFTMNRLVEHVNRALGRHVRTDFRIPFPLGLLIGLGADVLAAVTKRRFSISSIRVKKFCANSVYNTSIDKTGFNSPVPLDQALEQTIHSEFIGSHSMN